MAATEGQTQVLPLEINNEIIHWVAMDWSLAKMASLRLISREFDAWTRPFVLKSIYLGSFTNQRRKMAEQLKLLASGKTGASDVVRTLVIDYSRLEDPHGVDGETGVDLQILKYLRKIFSSCPKLCKVVLRASDKQTHMDQNIAIFRSIAKTTGVEELICYFKVVSELPQATPALNFLPMTNITTLRLDCSQWARSLEVSQLYIGTLIASCPHLTRLEVNLATTCAQIFGPTLAEGNTVQLPLEHLFICNSRDSLAEPEVFSRHLRRLKTFGFQTSAQNMLDVSWSLMAQYKIWPTQIYTKPLLERGLSPFLRYITQHPGLESLYYIDDMRNRNGDNPSIMLGLLAALVPRHVPTLQDLELFDSLSSWALSWPSHPDVKEMMKNQLGQLKSLRRFAIRIDWSMNRSFCSSTQGLPRIFQACIDPHSCHRHRDVLSDLLQFCSESFPQLRELVLPTWLNGYGGEYEWLPPHRRDPASLNNFYQSAIENTDRIARAFLEGFQVADPDRFCFQVVIGSNVYAMSWSEDLQRYAYQTSGPAA